MFDLNPRARSVAASVLAADISDTRTSAVVSGRVSIWRLIWLSCLFTMIAATANAKIGWWDEKGRPLRAQAIGDSVTVAMTGLDPATEYQLVLEDEAGVAVGGALVIADSEGEVAPTVLWASTGVVGCDFQECPEGPNLPAYRFARFEEAEQILGGRTFSLRLLDSSSGSEISSTDLILEVETVPRYFFSDGSGCPRRLVGNDEDVYMKGIHRAGDVSTYTLFLVESPSDREIGAELKDERGTDGGGFQTLSFNPSADTVLVLIWQGSASRPGTYDGLLREGMHEGEGASVQGGDRWLDPIHNIYYIGPESQDGLIIHDWPTGTCHSGGGGQHQGGGHDDTGGEDHGSEVGGG